MGKNVSGRDRKRKDGKKMWATHWRWNDTLHAFSAFFIIFIYRLHITGTGTVISGASGLEQEMFLTLPSCETFPLKITIPSCSEPPLGKVYNTGAFFLSMGKINIKDSNFSKKIK